MSREVDEWCSRIKSVEREHSAARLAFDQLLADPQKTAHALEVDVKVRDISHASDLLEGTYIIRLFAEFETGLRRYWETFRDTNPTMRDLVDGVASKRRIQDELIEGVHRVRKYRNILIHEREDDVQPISMASARSDLCQFFSHLPPVW